MTVSTFVGAGTAPAESNRGLNRVTAAVLLIEAFLIFVPMYILGNAINWPASLGDPAADVLPRIVEHAAAVRNGYFVYLIYSILFWPLSVLTIRVVHGPGPLSPLLRIAAGFGVISALARTLGIIRWLFPMPALAAMYVDPNTSATTREAIVVAYVALNEYAGTIGEVLGVSLFAALWVALVAVAILRSPRLPNWLGIFGFVAAAALASSVLELWGFDMGALITATVAVIHFWFMAAAVVFLRLRTGETALDAAG